jgi:DnaK suppressor protein
MNSIELERFRNILEGMKAELAKHSEETAEKRKPVELDQQSVGRLSRQDALQQQAMANAQEARRGMSIRKIDAALKRIDEQEYGWCAACGEEIALKRLEIDPTATYCAPCAGGAMQ